MKEAIIKTLEEFSKWDTCPSEIRIPKDAFIGLYGELIRETVVKIGEPLPLNGFWIDFNGPAGKVRIYPS